MTNQPTTPLKIDLRLLLESVAATLAFVLAGIAAVDLAAPWDILLPLIVGAAIIFINRILGKSSEAAIAELTNQVKALVAKNAVLQSDASAPTKRAADQAAEALRTGGAPPA